MSEDDCFSLLPADLKCFAGTLIIKIDGPSPQISISIYTVLDHAFLKY